MLNSKFDQTVVGFVKQGYSDEEIISEVSSMYSKHPGFSKHHVTRSIQNFKAGRIKE